MLQLGNFKYFLFFQRAPLDQWSTIFSLLKLNLKNTGHVFNAEDLILKQISSGSGFEAVVVFFFHSLAGLYQMRHFDEVLYKVCPQSVFAEGDNITDVALASVTI